MSTLTDSISAARSANSGLPTVVIPRVSITGCRPASNNSRTTHAPMTPVPPVAKRDRRAGAACAVTSYRAACALQPESTYRRSRLPGPLYLLALRESIPAAYARSSPTKWAPGRPGMRVRNRCDHVARNLAPLCECVNQFRGPLALRLRDILARLDIGHREPDKGRRGDRVQTRRTLQCTRLDTTG